MLKFALIAAAVLALPLAANAETSTAAKPAAKKSVKHSVKHTVKKKHQVTRRAAKAVEEVTPISQETDPVLNDADLAIAKRISTGRAQCELGADVTVTADDKKPGFFTVATKGQRYRMHPVESRTGAIRMEDPRAGAMWLQLGNKSMLMNQKQGIRIADDCQTAAQVAYSAEMKKNPPKALFDGADATK